MFDLGRFGVLNFVLGRVRIVIALGGVEILLLDGVVPLFERPLLPRFYSQYIKNRERYRSKSSAEQLRTP